MLVIIPSGALLEVATTTTPVLNSTSKSCFRIMASAMSVVWQKRTREEEEKRHIHLLYNFTFRCHIACVCGTEVKPRHRHSLLISANQVCPFSLLCVVIHTYTHPRTHTPKPLELTASGHEAVFCWGQGAEARQWTWANQLSRKENDWTQARKRKKKKKE